MYNFDRIITEIENELMLYEQVGAFKWADERGETAHFDAGEKLDYMLTHGASIEDVKKQIQVYKDAMISLFKRYKKAKGIDEAKRYIEALKTQKRAKEIVEAEQMGLPIDGIKRP